MWDRRRVVRAARRFEGMTPRSARALLRRFADGNSIRNEGCQVTCLAMVLALLDPHRRPAWDPGELNRQAHRRWFYRPSGLSMTTLYADLVSEASQGAAQLAIKEEYLPGVAPWPQVSVAASPLVRAYRGLAPSERVGLLVMLKTGTYDDTVASHYVLLHPDDTGGPDDRDPVLLDPAQPLSSTRRDWRLSDSARRITLDPAIARAWRRDGITADAIAGAWLFAAWDRHRATPATAALAHAWARESGGH